MTRELFDNRLRALRRDRAFRAGGDRFLHERAFADIVDRLGIVRRQFRSALLVGCTNPGWRTRLLDFADDVRVVDPGPLFAQASGGARTDEDRLDAEPGSFDLCVALGTLDTVNDLRQALLLVRCALRADSLFIGALAGGDTLPGLRRAMRAADKTIGSAAPRAHPRIEPGAFSALLAEAGFTMPVVDVDRVEVSYRSLWDLVRDLRAMGATNVLAERSKRPLSRAAAQAAANHFAAGASGGRTVERFELVHFAAWTPPEPANG
ncbi:MAG TPA: SAM-dependent methyltransferase [Sphingomicrobium sp.]|nr:SAM-dependent methyltransferase [Sphingomicrobium sp.]